MDASDILALVALVLSVFSVFLHWLEYRLHWREFHRGERSLAIDVDDIKYIHEPETLIYTTRFVVTAVNVGPRSVQIKGARLKLKSGGVFETPQSEIRGQRFSPGGPIELKEGDRITADFVAYEGGYDSQAREARLLFRPNEVRAVAFVDIDGKEYEKEISGSIRRQISDQWPRIVKKY